MMRIVRNLCRRFSRINHWSAGCAEQERRRARRQIGGAPIFFSRAGSAIKAFFARTTADRSRTDFFS
jgi:hypothetical protein